MNYSKQGDRPQNTMDNNHGGRQKVGRGVPWTPPVHQLLGVAHWLVVPGAQCLKIWSSQPDSLKRQLVLESPSPGPGPLRATTGWKFWPYIVAGELTWGHQLVLVCATEIMGYYQVSEAPWSLKQQ